jgi:uncharacterized protein YaeQ
MYAILFRSLFMALKATIYKAAVNVADLDRNQFLDANLTLAQHRRKPRSA